MKQELASITNVQGSAASYKNYQRWPASTQFENQVSRQDYFVSNRGLRSDLTGTLQRIVDRIEAFKAVGVDFFPAVMPPPTRSEVVQLRWTV